MTTEHGFDLGKLNRAQLKQLAADVAKELTQREHEDRAALETRLQALCEEHGFDGTVVRLAGNGKRAARRTDKKGETEHD